MEKRVKDSYSEQVHVLTQANINKYNILFGSQVVSWTYAVAEEVAQRHSGHNVEVGTYDKNIFCYASVYPDDTLIVCGFVTYVKGTSMEVCVNSYVENLSGERKLVNQAYFIMVAIDENEKPVEVPRLILETEEDRENWESARKRERSRERVRRSIHKSAISETDEER